MTARILLYVQHLKGLGHIYRADRIVAALLADGFEVTVAFGGLPVAGRWFDGARLAQLEPIGTPTGSFSSLVGADGNPVDDAFKARRRAELLKLYDAVRPTILITELYPLGRRAMRFELLPLVKHAHTSTDRPLIVASVRDILQRPRSLERAMEQVELVRAYYDAILVHGDPAFARLDTSFPEASAFNNLIHYTGLVGPSQSYDAIAPEDAVDVVVSVGGGAVGHDILKFAIEAKPLTILANARWLVLTGPGAPADVREALSADAVRNNIRLEPYRADLPRTLRAAQLSIQMAGYNTVADMLVAGCRAVLIPFVEGGETEQRERAVRLEQLGRVVMVPPETANAHSLAAAIDRAMLQNPTPISIDLDGARTSAQLLRHLLKQSHGTPRLV